MIESPEITMKVKFIEPWWLKMYWTVDGVHWFKELGSWSQLLRFKKNIMQASKKTIPANQIGIQLHFICIMGYFNQGKRSLRDDSIFPAAKFYWSRGRMAGWIHTISVCHNVICLVWVIVLCTLNHPFYVANHVLGIRILCDPKVNNFQYHQTIVHYFFPSLVGFPEDGNRNSKHKRVISS